MRKLIQSWLFFTALLLFLLISASILPTLSGRFFGATEMTLADAFARAEAETQQVWGSLVP